MMGVLLAGGSGTRLYHALGTVKLFARVGGSRLLCYPLGSLWRAGVSHTVVAAPPSRLGLLLDAARQCAGSPLVTGAEAPRAWMGSGYTLLDALGGVTPEWPIVVSVGDHVYEDCLVRRLVRGCSSLFCVAGDRDPRLVDPSEATKISAQGGRVTGIGKGLRQYDYIDAGVHVFNAHPGVGTLLVAPLSLNDIKRRLARLGLLEVVDVTGCLWADVDTPGDLERLVSGPGRVLLEKMG